MATYYTNYGGYRNFSLFPPVIKSLLIANLVVFVLQHLFFGLLTIEGVPVQYYLMRWFALQPLDSGYLFPWQLFTYQFMHGGFLHLFFNMFALWMFGAELESIWGGRRFFVFYVLCGIGAALIHILINFLFNDGAPTVGASGSINGILLAFGFMFPDRPIIMFPIFFPIPAKILVLLWIAIDLVSGLTGASSGVAHFAHVGGALCGFLLLKYGDKAGVFALIDRITDTLSGRRRIISSSRKIYDIGSINQPSRSSWFRATESRKGEQDAVSQEEIDYILDKIARTGYNSLTEEEKHKLYDASKKL